MPALGIYSTLGRDLSFEYEVSLRMADDVTAA
jgi:hypothetical protein